MRFQHQVRVHAQQVVVPAIQRFPDRHVPQLAHPAHQVVCPQVVLVHRHVLCVAHVILRAPDVRDHFVAVVHNKIPVGRYAVRHDQAVQPFLVFVEDLRLLPERCRNQNPCHWNNPPNRSSPAYTGMCAICPGLTVGSHQISRPISFTRQQNAKSSARCSIGLKVVPK